MKLFFRLVGGLVLITLLTLGYLGFIPGLSTVMGGNKPRDLGVKYTPQDIASAQTKSQVTIKEVNSLPPGSPLVFEGSQQVANSFSSTELTALAAGARWQYYPVTNIQIKANSDGTAEVSGNLNLKILPSYFASFGVDSADVNKAISYLKLQGSPSFYLKGKAAVLNNQVQLQPSAVVIGRLPIPADLIKTGSPYLARVAQNRINSIPGLKIDEFKVDQGKFLFQGSVPSVVTRQKTSGNH